MGKPNSFPFQISAIFAIFLVLGFASASFSSDPFAEQERDRVGRLPGQNFSIDFAHYAGYVTVNEEAGRALFYWFIEADSDPQSKPLVLWLNGGPGCSSIAYGEAEELGPFHIRRDGKTLYLNQFAWNRVANVIFLESPVGVGFSYSNTSSDLLDNGDNRTAVDNLSFLLNWFERFPQYKGRDFYLTGESYAGHYVPQLTQAIVKYNQEAKEAINLKGYMVGNALTDDFHDQLGIAQFLWSTGLISDQTYQQMNIQCDLENIEYWSDSCDNIWEIAYAEIGDIDMYSIFTPTCPTSSVRLRNRRLKRKHRLGRLRDAYDPCTEEYSTIYFNLPEVQEALHVDPAHKPPQWETCSDLVGDNWQDSALTVLDIYHELFPLGLRIWMYSGDTDSVIPVTSTRYTIDSLNLTTISPWRAWYDDGQVGGWTEEYDGLTFVAVRGAGHEVPLHRPNLALTLIKSFLAGSPMPSSSSLQLHSAS